MAAPQVPTRRRAYCFDPATKRCQWQDLDIPPLPENFILVKIESATIVSLDFQFMSGSQFMGFGVGPGPHILGSQGAGSVVAYGPGKGSSFFGRKVSVMPARPGVWTDYAIVHVNDAMILDDRVTWEDGATAMMYPLTALMALDLAKRLQSRAVVLTAASSSLGRQIIRLFQNNGIEVVSLVRKAEKGTQLATEGARNVLNSTDTDFEKKFVEMCARLKVNLVFECVGGDALTKLIGLSPPGSTVCILGSLTSQNFGTVSNSDLFQGKILMAGNVFSFWGRLHSDEKVKEVECINRELTTTFRTTVIRTVPFLRIEEGFKAYEENKKGPSIDGKIVLKWQ
jgi:NADPH:quinone reductase-like Zn-dependent oxidoreductase